MYFQPVINTIRLRERIWPNVEVFEIEHDILAVPLGLDLELTVQIMWVVVLFTELQTERVQVMVIIAGHVDFLVA